MPRIIALILLLTLSCTEPWKVNYSGPVDNKPILYVYNQMRMNDSQKGLMTSTRYLDVINPSNSDMVLDVACTSGMYPGLAVPARSSVRVMLTDAAVSCTATME